MDIINLNKKIIFLIISTLVISIIVVSNYTNNNNNANNNNSSLYSQQQIAKRDETIRELKQQLKDAEDERDSLLSQIGSEQDKDDADKQFDRHGIKYYDHQLDVTKKRLAYAFYITDNIYYCAAATTAHRLRKWTNYDIVFIFLDGLVQPSQSTTDSINKLTNIHYIHIGEEIKKSNGGDPTWRNSLNKFYVFNMTQYDRIIFMDADTYVLKNMDHLFFLPECQVAAPRAYWLPQPFFTSLLMVIQPSEQLFKNIVARSHGHPGFDMDVLNDYFVHSQDFIMLPGIYGLLNTEFSTNEKHWFGEDIEDTYKNKAFFYHWSFFKPWNIGAGDSRVIHHGEIIKETYNSYYEGKNLYC